MELTLERIGDCTLDSSRGRTSDQGEVGGIVLIEFRESQHLSGSVNPPFGPPRVRVRESEDEVPSWSPCRTDPKAERGLRVEELRSLDFIIRRRLSPVTSRPVE